MKKTQTDVSLFPERVKLKRSDFPLVLRIMQGPCEQVCKVFLMEEDLGEEVTYDVNPHVYSEHVAHMTTRPRPPIHLTSPSLCVLLSPPCHQVAQYIKFEMPVLQSFITKLKEEEDREVLKLRSRYLFYVFIS